MERFVNWLSEMIAAAFALLLFWGVVWLITAAATDSVDRWRRMFGAVPAVATAGQIVPKRGDRLVPGACVADAEGRP